MSQFEAKFFQCRIYSVAQAHCKSSFSLISEAFDTMCDDTTERAYKQNKSAQQKQYRDREVDSFAELREVIRKVTDDQEPPRTRHETHVASCTTHQAA